MGAKVSVIGLGKLGCPLAACFAANGGEVVGVDMEQRAVDAVNQGKAPTVETGLQDLMNQLTGNLRATQDFVDAVTSTDVTFVVVPTPSGEDGTFINDYVVAACRSIGQGLKEKSSYHVVTIVSTVMPGSTGGVIRQALEEASGKTCGVDFGLCYSPAFVALGSVIRNFLRPDYLLIGESDPKAGETLEQFYQGMCDDEPRAERMSFVNAELTKLATNAFVSTKITFGNMMAQLCEHLPGADVDIVTSALGMDSRIGVKYLKGGIGYGGPCLDRDNVALVAMAGNIGSEAILAEATDRANRLEVSRLVDIIKSKRDTSNTVGVLGLSYKPDTNVIDASQGVLLAQALGKEGYPVVAYDPAAMETTKQMVGESVTFAASAERCIEESAVIVISTPWNCFAEIRPGLFTGKTADGAPKVLIDCWRMLNAETFAAITDYVPLGIGPEHQ